jgi:hypothetical protein
MAVQVDIPGIGTVVAQNAAQDSTLQGILNTLQNQAGGTVSTAGVQQLNAASGGAAAGLTRVSRSSTDAGESIERAGASASRAGSNFNQAAKSVFASFGALASQSTSASGSMKAFVDGAGELTRGIGNAIWGGLGTALAGTLGLVTGVLVKNIEQYEKVTAAGGSFGYSIEQFRLSAEAAGMSTGELAAVVQKTGASMAMFGGSTVSGSQTFARFSKTIRDGAIGDTLLRMGIGYQEQSEMLSEFMGELAKGGENIAAIPTQQLTTRFLELTQQSKLMAQYNGTTLEQERQKIKVLEKDKRVQAALAGLSGEQRAAMTRLMKDAESRVGGSGKAIEELLLYGTYQTTSLMMDTMPAYGDKLKDMVFDVAKQNMTDPTEITNRLNAATQSITVAQRNALAELAKIWAMAPSTATEQFATAYVGARDEVSKKINDTWNRIAKDQEYLGKATDEVTQAMINANKLSNRFVRMMNALINAGMTSDTFQALLASGNAGVTALTEQIAAGEVQISQQDVSSQAVKAATLKVEEMGKGVANALVSGFKKFWGVDDVDQRALGGPVFPGQRYLVGERGPELLELNQAGMITPNYKLNDIGSLPDMAGFSQALQQSIEEIRDIGSMTATSQSTNNVIDDETKDAILQLPMLLHEVNSQQERMIRSVDDSGRMIAHAVS